MKNKEKIMEDQQDRKHDYSGVYSSIYTFYDNNPSIKPQGWQDVEMNDVDDMEEVLRPLDYTVLYAGDWGREVLYSVAIMLQTLKKDYDSLVFDSEEDIVVMHNDQFVDFVRIVLDHYGINIHTEMLEQL